MILEDELGKENSEEGEWREGDPWEGGGEKEGGRGKGEGGVRKL